MIYSRRAARLTQSPDRKSHVEMEQKSSRRLTISELAEQVPYLGHAIVYNIVTKKLENHTLCAGCVPKMFIVQECSVDECFWMATDKMDIICFPVLLPGIKRGKH